MVGTVHFFNVSCTAVGPDCPVENSVYGYYPHLGINVFLVTAFACLVIIHTYLGIWKKTYFFAGLLISTCAGEVAGYSGRLMLYRNPYNHVGFALEISCLAFAPSFLAAAVHATLKHITLTFGATTSILPPPMYTWMFIAFDMLCLALLAVGGALAGNARFGRDSGVAGYVLVIAGMIVQILTLVIFAGLVVDYLYRTRRAWHNVPFAATKLLDTLKFKLFVTGVSIAYTGVLTRCIYRLLELSGGWPNGVMRSQAAFVIFESCMILAASLAFTVFHPGFCFALSRHSRYKRKWRITFSEPIAQERRVDLEMICRGRPSQPELSLQQPVELPSPTDSRLELDRQDSAATTLATKASQLSLMKKPTETWYSIDSDGIGGAEASQHSPTHNVAYIRESSRETWYSDATLKEGDADITKPRGQSS